VELLRHDVQFNVDYVGAPVQKPALMHVGAHAALVLEEHVTH